MWTFRAKNFFPRRYRRCCCCCRCRRRRRRRPKVV